MAAGAVGPAAHLTVLITGVTSGIGRALAVAFAARGDTVIGCGRRLENLAALATELGSPGKHLLCQCDVANTSSVERFGLEVDARLPGGRGRVDLLICNAGVAIRQRPLWKTSQKEFDLIVDVNVRGVFITMKAFVPAMIECCPPVGVPPKRVINISSGLAHSTSPVDGSYSGTKWMVEAMSKSMAQAFQSPHATPAHLVASGVGPNIICVPLAPGVLQTEMNPGGGDLDGWIKVAVPFMLKLGLDDSGRSLTMPGYYAKNYMDTWVIPDGMRLATGFTAPAAE